MFMSPYHNNIWLWNAQKQKTRTSVMEQVYRENQVWIKEKIYSSTLNMKYKAWCPLPIKESSKMWIELLNFPATFILTSDFRISCHYKLSLSLILISVASASARRSLPNTVHQYVPHGWAFKHLYFELTRRLRKLTRDISL